MSEQTLSVGELTAQIRGLLESEFSKVEVRGEISNFRRQSSGHIYFTLKDADAQIKAVFFRGDVRGLKFDPKDGMSVVLFGEVTVYPVRGEYQIRVMRMAQEGKGTLQEQFEQLKNKLLEEGLFEQERKKELPIFPRKIAIVTSPTGAALQDFLQIIQRRCPRLVIQVFGVKVQGQGAAAEIASAVIELNRLAEVDVIVVARGGGSIEDLWAFNEEPLIRVLAHSTIPVISAVGHETDFTLSDFVADLRAPTPSAAAELISLADEEWLNRLRGLEKDLKKEVASFLQLQKQRLTLLRTHYVFKEPVRIVEQWFQRTDELKEKLCRALKSKRDRSAEHLVVIKQRWVRVEPKRRIKELRQILKERAKQLRLLSPEQTIKRGYTITLDQKGKVVRTKVIASKAKNLIIRFSDGDQDVTVESK